MKKNIENSDMPISSPTMFAPRSVRRRKIENGISGWRWRSSMTRKATSRTDGAGEPQHRRGRSPAGVDGVDDGVDEQRQAGRDGDRAGEVKRAGGRPRRGSRRASAARAGRRGDTDRDVDEQHPAPAQPAGEDPAEQHAGGAAGARHRAPDPERTVALGALRERGRDDRQRRRRDDRGAEALHRAGGDQPSLGLGDPAGERGQREQHQADHEHPPAPEQVGQPAAEQQEAAEGQRVGVHHPGQVVCGEVQGARRSTAARR